MTEGEPARKCGECGLCCKLLPVKSLGKPANTRCQFQRMSKGCTIYAKRPFDCQTWACRWLVDPATAGLPRPDRSHYVVDIMPDFITIDQHDGAGPVDIPVLQIWVDPAYPDAHRTPALREYMQRMAVEEGMAALVRWDSKRAVTVFAPFFSSDGQWHEREGTCRAEERIF
jgi:hypothetical protein